MTAWSLFYPGILAMPGIMALSWQRGLNTETLMITAGVLLACVLMHRGSVAILRLTGPSPSRSLTRLNKPAGKWPTPAALSVGHVMSMDFGMANAFAFPWTKDLAFTRLILRTTLDDEELAFPVGTWQRDVRRDGNGWSDCCRSRPSAWFAAFCPRAAAIGAGLVHRRIF